MKGLLNVGHETSLFMHEISRSMALKVRRNDEIFELFTAATFIAQLKGDAERFNRDLD
jgi:hypothetical protein